MKREIKEVLIEDIEDPNEDKMEEDEDEEYDDEEEDDSDDEEEDEEDEDTVNCDICGNEYPSSEEGKTIFYYEEGDNVDDFHICKKCIDKKYKHEPTVIEKIVEREVYLNPDNTKTKQSSDLFRKTKFD